MDASKYEDRQALTAIMAETVKRCYCAKTMVLAEDAEHVYMDGLDDDGEHVLFRYFVPLETWDALKVIARGGGKVGDIPCVLLPARGEDEDDDEELIA